MASLEASCAEDDEKEMGNDQMKLFSIKQWLSYRESTNGQTFALRFTDRCTAPDVALAVFTSSLESHLATLHLSSGVQQLINAQHTRLAGITIPTSASGEVQAALKRAIDESFVSAFRLVSLLGAALAVLSAMSAWLLVEGKQLERAGGSASKPQASIAGADEQAPQISAN